MSDELSEMRTRAEIAERNAAAWKARCLAAESGDGPPLKAFCAAYDTWTEAIRANGMRGHSAEAVVEKLRDVRLLIRKSNLLDRLVFGGQALRVRRCSKHSGRWSGLPSPENNCECDLTGWLPELAHESGGGE